MKIYEIDYFELKIPGVIQYAHIGYWKVCQERKQEFLLGYILTGLAYGNLRKGIIITFVNIQFSLPYTFYLKNLCLFFKLIFIINLGFLSEMPILSY